MSPKAQTRLPLILCLLLFAQCGGSKRDDTTLRFFQRGNIEMKKGNTPEAIRLYTEAIEADRDYADAYNNRGVAYIKYGDAEKAAADFDRAIGHLVMSVEGTVKALLVDAGISAAQIDTVFFTGGSSSVPLLRERISALLPDAKRVEGDLFGSIGAGLALDAKRKFG